MPLVKKKPPYFHHMLQTNSCILVMASATEQLQTITQLIQMLPIENFNTLKYLMEHLHR